jgi:hypothetical protein
LSLGTYIDSADSFWDKNFIHVPFLFLILLVLVVEQGALDVAAARGRPAPFSRAEQAAM